jgi:Tol biopolymer transport system component
LAVATDDGKEAMISIYNLKTGGTLRRLTIGGRNLFPIWTPDSLSITFQSDREGDRGIFQQLADGSRPAERLTKAEQGAVHAPEAWSHDGKTLVFRSGITSAGSALWTLTVGDKSPKRFDDSIKVGHFNASFSPDGRWLAYSSFEVSGNTPRIFVQPFPRTDAKYQPVASLSTSAVWSQDGKQMFFDDGPSTSHLMMLDVHATPASLTFGAATPIQTAGIDKPVGGWRPYDVTPDGRKFLIVALPQSDSKNGAAPRTEMNVVLNWFEELKTRVPVK